MAVCILFGILGSTVVVGFAAAAIAELLTV